MTIDSDLKIAKENVEQAKNFIGAIVFQTGNGEDYYSFLCVALSALDRIDEELKK